MKITRALVVSSVIGFAGCAGAPDGTQEPSEEAANEDDAVGSTTQALWIAPINTIPPSEAGFRMYKGLPYVWSMLNGQGRAAFPSGSGLATRILSRATDERFALYEKRDGSYSLCRPGTLVKRSVTLPYPYGTNINYEADCIFRAVGSHEVRFGRTVLSQTATGTTGPFYVTYGEIEFSPSPRVGYHYWVMRGEYVTNNSSNVIVGGNKSGNDDQVWRAISLK